MSRHHARKPTTRGVLLALLLFAGPAAAGPIQLDIAGARLEVHALEAPAALDMAPFLDWLRGSAEVVAAYYGRFPVPDARVELSFFPGGGTLGGAASSIDGPRITLAVGSYSSAAELARDWRLVHEMIHLALPELPVGKRWLAEGLSTYLESITRLRAGQLDEAFVWGGFVRGMPRGLPQAGETGFDGSRRLGRVYWGGALFCLLADIAIREQTANRHSLRDGLRAIVEAPDRDALPLSGLLSLADAATGTDVLSALHASASHENLAVDLEALWHSLGVIVDGDRVRFDQQAPRAAIRRAISTPGS